MYDSRVKEYIELTPITKKTSRTGELTRPFKDFVLFLEENSIDLFGLLDCPLKTILHCIKNDVMVPRCKCGKITEYRKTEKNPQTFYEAYCSFQCRSSSLEFCEKLSKVKTELYKNPTWKEEVERKKVESTKASLGVDYPMQSSAVFLTHQKSSFKRKGKLQGFEPYAYDYLNTLYADLEIGAEFLHDSNLCIQWLDSEGKNRRSYPDFFTATGNIFIEIKSEYTRRMHEYKLMRCKEALKDMGYGYVIITVNPKKSFIQETFNIEHIL